MDEVDRKRANLPGVEAIRLLMARVPLNNYGLPDGIYRSDMLPLVNGTAAAIRTELALPGTTVDVSLYTALLDLGYDPKQAGVAWISLDYSEGFPTLSGGRPFWCQLDFEPPLSHKSLEVYLKQGSMGVRQLYSLRNDMVDEFGPELPADDDLLQWYHLYHWGARARAYDLFEEVVRRKVRNQRAMSVEDEHFLLSERLMGKLQLYMEDDDFIETMTPKAAIDFLKLLVSMQRISTGLPANGPSPNVKGGDGGSNGTPVEIMLRQIVEQQQDGARAVTIDGNTSDVDSRLMRVALSDPKTAELAQELVIRINAPGSPN